MFLANESNEEIDLNKYLSYKRDEKVTNYIPTDIKKPTNLLPIDKALELISSNFVDRFSGKTFKLFLAAGVHPEFSTINEANLFNTVFGRDMLIQIKFLRKTFELLRSKGDSTCLDQSTITLINEYQRTIPLDAVKFLSIYQGRGYNPNSEEEPGKILHEFRYDDDRIAIELNIARQWEWPYFGSIDATCEYISLLASLIIENSLTTNIVIQNYFDKKNYTLLECLNMALDCLLSWQNQDGLIYYSKKNPLGIEIQSWRDSFDSVSTKESGQLPDFNLPIALYDLQISALQALENYQLLPHELKAQSLEKAILNLKNSIKQKLWLENSGYFAQGYQVNPSGILFDSLASSNLSIIDVSIIKELNPTSEKLSDYVHRILNNLECDYGLMTLSSDNNRYHPCGYHTGNIWLFDTMLASLGLIDLGYTKQAKILASKTIDVIKSTNLYPELVGKYGHNEVILDVFDTESNFGNRIVQPGQPLQGWSVMAYLMALVVV